MLSAYPLRTDGYAAVNVGVTIERHDTKSQQNTCTQHFLRFLPSSHLNIHFEKKYQQTASVQTVQTISDERHTRDKQTHRVAPGVPGNWEEWTI